MTHPNLGLGNYWKLFRAILSLLFYPLNVAQARLFTRSRSRPSLSAGHVIG